MSILAGVGFLAGVVILALLAADVFITVLHHWEGLGPIGGTLSGAIWSTALRITRGMPSARRRHVLGWIGPALIPIVVGSWAFLAVLSFALIYLPWVPTAFETRDPFTFSHSFLDTFYYSGVTFLTLGYGDVVPTTTGTRLLALIQGGSGFGMITLAISYFTSLYSAYARQKVAAESIHHQAGDSANSVRIIVGHLTEGTPVDVLAGEVGRLRDGLVRVSSDYGQYPMLYYFPPSVPERSFLRLLFVAYDTALVLDTAIDARAQPEVAGMGHRLGLDRAARSFTKSLSEFLLRDSAPDGSARAADDRHLTQRFHDARETLRENGFAVREGDEPAREYARRRARWEPVLRACAERLGEDWELVTGGA